MTGYRRLWRDSVLTFAVLGLLAMLAAKLNPAPDFLQNDEFSVVDGDSLTRRGVRLRLAGIDAPEYRQQCQRDGTPWPCGQTARDVLAQLLPGGHAECRGRQRDRYDRLLVACRAGGLDVNAEMVRRGMAVAFGRYQVEEAAARAAKAGLWAGSFERPQDYRRDGGSGAERDGDRLADVGSYLRQLVGLP